MAGAANQGQQGDNSTSILWGMVAIFAVVFFVWYAFHTEIVNVILYIKKAELYIVGTFIQNANSLQKVVSTLNPSTITFDQLSIVCEQVGNFIKYPIALIIGFLAYLAYKSGAKNSFRTTYSMDKLLMQEKENWPQIAPVAHLTLVKDDIDAGPWAMAENPMQFVKKNKLIREEVEPVPEDQLMKSQKLIVKVIRNKATQAMARQLGRHWRGPEKLRPHVKALFTAFAAKADGNRDSSIALLRSIAASAEHGKPNFSGADDLFNKHKNSKLIEKISDKHAYEMTMMATLLEVARLDGVLASAEFIWLKPLDRPLWYMLNTVGRRVAPVEVAGAYAHWLSEKALGRKLTVPMVEQAVEALEMAISEIIYKKDD